MTSFRFRSHLFYVWYKGTGMRRTICWHVTLLVSTYYCNVQEEVNIWKLPIYEDTDSHNEKGSILLYSQLTDMENFVLQRRR